MERVSMPWLSDATVDAIAVFGLAAMTLLVNACGTTPKAGFSAFDDEIRRAHV